MGLFQRGSQAWLGPQELTSPAPPPPPPPLTSPGNSRSQSQLRTGLCVLGRPWGERHDADLGEQREAESRERVERGPQSRKGWMVAITLISPFLQPQGTESGREWKARVEPWPSSGADTHTLPSLPFHEGGVLTSVVSPARGRSSYQQPPPQAPAAGVTQQVRLSHGDPPSDSQVLGLREGRGRVLLSSRTFLPFPLSFSRP